MSTFTKKVGCAVASCRKVVLLASVAAMASGAWAADEGVSAQNYEFQLSILNIPQDFKSLSGEARYYLVDTSDNRVLAYLANSSFVDNKTTTYWKGSAQVTDKDNYDKSMTQLNGLVNYSGLGGTKAQLPNGEYTFADNIYIASGSGTSVSLHENGTKDVEFKMQRVNVTESALYQTGMGDAGNLMMIVYDPGIGYYQEFSKVTFNATSQTSVNYQASEPYAVPEPTSAMLLLLGFAGLALKRKRVA